MAENIPLEKNRIPGMTHLYKREHLKKTITETFKILSTILTINVYVRKPYVLGHIRSEKDIIGRGIGRDSNRQPWISPSHS